MGKKHTHSFLLLFFLKLQIFTYLVSYLFFIFLPSKFKYCVLYVNHF